LNVVEHKSTISEKARGLTRKKKSGTPPNSLSQRKQLLRDVRR